MSTFLTLLHHGIEHAAAILPTDLGIDDVGIQTPPGARAKASTLIGVARWGGGVIAVGALIGLGVRMFGSDRQHTAGEKAQSAGWWFAGAFIVSSAISIAGWVMG